MADTGCGHSSAPHCGHSSAPHGGEGQDHSPQVQGFEPVTVTATLATAERSLSGVHVVFSDGDPQQGGAAFDAELIPHIRANDLYVTQVKFHPRTCGTHTVFVVAGEARRPRRPTRPGSQSSVSRVVGSNGCKRSQTRPKKRLRIVGTICMSTGAAPPTKSSGEGLSVRQWGHRIIE